MLPQKKEQEVARLIAEVLREEAEKAPVPPAEMAWERLKPHLKAASRLRPTWRRLLPAVGLAAALLLVLGGIFLAGQAGLGRFQAKSDKVSSAGPAQVAKEEALPKTSPPAKSETRISYDAAPAAGAPGAAGQDELRSRPPEPNVAKEAGSRALAPGKEQGLKQGQVEAEKAEAAVATAQAAEQGKAPAAAKRPEAASLSGGRSGGRTIEPPEERVSWEEAQKLAPFPLPHFASLPPTLELTGVTIRRLDRDRAVVRLVYEEAGGTFVRFRVGNVPPEADGEGPVPGETVREIEVGGAPALLRVRDDVTVLSWRRENLYLELETNLEVTRAVGIAESLKWGD